MAKSAEDVGREVAQALWRDYQKTGVINNAIIAAAIREDRAEMVSECELTLDYVGGMLDELLEFGATDDDLRTLRARITKQLESLEAARKARAG